MGEILLCFGYSGVSLIMAIIIYRSLKREFKSYEGACDKQDNEQ